LGDADAARQQLDYSSRQLFADPVVTDDWKRYLALPPQVSTQQALQHYEDVSRNPQYTALSSRSDFQQTLTALRRINDVRTASNATNSLPPPPR
jgi:hypothetical protein